MKICRINCSYSSANNPGQGQIAFYLSSNIPEPQLWITRKQEGIDCSQLPRHVKLLPLSFPQIALSRGRTGFPWRILKVGYKVLGQVIYFLKSAVPLVRFRPDIVDIHTPYPILGGLFCKYLLGSKLVVSLHGTDILMLRQSLLMRSLLNSADMVLYVSKRMFGELKQFIPVSKLQYIGNGVNLDSFHYKAGHRTKRIVAVGSLKWQKGYSYLIDAISQVFEQLPDHKLSIVGEGSLRNEILGQIEKLGLNKKIELLGTCSRQEIAALLQSSELFVLSSVSEGLPRVVLEAIACGTPVVVTDVGDCKEVAEGVGLVVEPYNAQALAEAISELIENEDMWKAFAENCLRLRANYDWKFVVKRTYTAYKALLSAENDK